MKTKTAPVPPSNQPTIETQLIPYEGRQRLPALKLEPLVDFDNFSHQFQLVRRGVSNRTSPSHAFSNLDRFFETNLEDFKKQIEPLSSQSNIFNEQSRNFNMLSPLSIKKTLSGEEPVLNKRYRSPSSSSVENMENSQDNLNSRYKKYLKPVKGKKPRCFDEFELRKSAAQEKLDQMHSNMKKYLKNCSRNLESSEQASPRIKVSTEKGKRVSEKRFTSGVVDNKALFPVAECADPREKSFGKTSDSFEAFNNPLSDLYSRLITTMGRTERDHRNTLSSIADRYESRMETFTRILNNC